MSNIESREPMNENALEGALNELRGLGVQDGDLESKANQLQIGESLSGDLPDKSVWKLTREAENSWNINTNNAEK